MPTGKVSISVQENSSMKYYIQVTRHNKAHSVATAIADVFQKKIKLAWEIN